MSGGAHACALVLLLGGFASAPLDVEGQPAAERQSAITLGREAKEHYDRGDWRIALDLFTAAEARAHSPVLLLYSARCHRNLGQLLRAREIYRALLVEQLASDAPEPFRNAKSDAEKDLQTLVERVPRFTLRANGLPSDAVIEVDKLPLSAERRGAPIEADPGVHVARAMQAGRQVAEAQFQLREAESITVTLTVAPAGSPPPSSATPALSRDPALDILGSVALVLGAGGLATAIATKVISFDIVDDVESRCEGVHCLARDEAEIDRAYAMQTGSTVAFVLGGLFTVTGLVLLIVGARAEPKPVALEVGPLGLRLYGTF